MLLLSNLPVLAIHKMMFIASDRSFGEMLFINFIGPEPKSLFKTLYIDFITIVLQTILLQCKWDILALRIISALPVPACQPLVPISEDPDANNVDNQHSPTAELT